MRVLLINSNRRRDVFAALPIGLCYVANFAEEAGHEVHVLDLCFQRNIHQALAHAVSDFRPQVVGISVRNIDNVNMLYPVKYLPQVRDIVKFVRSISGAPIVVGGPGVSMVPKEVLEMLGADFVVVSDGERGFAELLDCLQQGRSPARVPGVGMMADARFHLTPPTLNEFPRGNPMIGKWTDVHPYVKLGSAYPIQTKRGCVHHCIYCLYGTRLEGRKPRLRAPRDVVDEIRDVTRTCGALNFEFVDSVFNDPIDHCTAILEELKTLKTKATFSATTLVPNRLDAPFLELMWQAGFRSFSISPESASAAMIENYHKGFTIEDLNEAVRAINRTAFTVLWFFMIGGPGETNETLQETLDFCLRHFRTKSPPPLHVANLMMGVRLYPGSELWDIAVGEGFVSEDNDPLDQLWYLSEKLDLDRAVRQMIDAARQCPELIAGYDERYMVLSSIAALLARALRLRRPYWTIMRTANRIFRKPGLMLSFRPRKVVAMLEGQLERQGYYQRRLPASGMTQ